MRLDSLRMCRGFSGIVFLFAAAVGTAAYAQTDVALSGFAAFSNSTKPGSTDFYREIPADAGGGLFEVRHIFNSYFGLEASYSFRSANEVFDDLVALTGNPVGEPRCVSDVCPPATYAVSANAQEFAVDWVQEGKSGSFRPFVALGAGLLWTRPSGGQSGYPTSSRQPAFDYGVGVDWGLARHVGLRLQFRGSLNRATGFVANDASPGFVNTVGPGVGVYYRF